MPLELRRLADVPVAQLIELFNHPGVRRHLPLAKGEFTREHCRRFVRAKETVWAEHGYGPWAVYFDGHFAGWGGLQPEGPDVDLALVLHPRYWGRGAAVVREFLRQAFGEFGLTSVIVLLPPTRTRVRALERLGFRRDGEVVLQGERFLRHRLSRSRPPHPARG